MFVINQGWQPAQESLIADRQTSRQQVSVDVPAAQKLKIGQILLKSLRALQSDLQKCKENIELWPIYQEVSVNNLLMQLPAVLISDSLQDAVVYEPTSRNVLKYFEFTSSSMFMPNYVRAIIKIQRCLIATGTPLDDWKAFILLIESLDAMASDEEIGEFKEFALAFIESRLLSKEYGHYALIKDLRRVFQPLMRGNRDSFLESATNVFVGLAHKDKHSMSLIKYEALVDYLHEVECLNGFDAAEWGHISIMQLVDQWGQDNEAELRCLLKTLSAHADNSKLISGMCHVLNAKLVNPDTVSELLMELEKEPEVMPVLTQSQSPESALPLPHEAPFRAPVEVSVESTLESTPESSSESDSESEEEEIVKPAPRALTDFDKIEKLLSTPKLFANNLLMSNLLKLIEAVQPQNTDVWAKVIDAIKKTKQQDLKKRFWACWTKFDKGQMEPKKVASLWQKVLPLMVANAGADMQGFFFGQEFAAVLRTLDSEKDKSRFISYYEGVLEGASKHAKPKDLLEAHFANVKSFSCLKDLSGITRHTFPLVEKSISLREKPAAYYAELLLPSLGSLVKELSAGRIIKCIGSLMALVDPDASSEADAMLSLVEQLIEHAAGQRLDVIKMLMSEGLDNYADLSLILLNRHIQKICESHVSFGDKRDQLKQSLDMVSRVLDHISGIGYLCVKEELVNRIRQAVELTKVPADELWEKLFRWELEVNPMNTRNKIEDAINFSLMLPDGGVRSTQSLIDKCLEWPEISPNKTADSESRRMDWTFRPQNVLFVRCKSLLKHFKPLKIVMKGGVKTEILDKKNVLCLLQKCLDRARQDKEHRNDYNALAVRLIGSTVCSALFSDRESMELIVGWFFTTFFKKGGEGEYAFEDNLPFICINDMFDVLRSIFDSKVASAAVANVGKNVPDLHAMLQDSAKCLVNYKADEAFNVGSIYCQDVLEDDSNEMYTIDELLELLDDVAACCTSVWETPIISEETKMNCWLNGFGSYLELRKLHEGIVDIETKDEEIPFVDALKELYLTLIQVVDDHIGEQITSWNKKGKDASKDDFSRLYHPASVFIEAFDLASKKLALPGLIDDVMIVSLFEMIRKSFYSLNDTVKKKEMLDRLVAICEDHLSLQQPIIKQLSLLSYLSESSEPEEGYHKRRLASEETRYFKINTDLQFPQANQKLVQRNALLRLFNGFIEKGTTRGNLLALSLFRHSDLKPFHPGKRSLELAASFERLFQKIGEDINKPEALDLYLNENAIDSIVAAVFNPIVNKETVSKDNKNGNNAQNVQGTPSGNPMMGVASLTRSTLPDINQKYMLHLIGASRLIMEIYAAQCAMDGDKGISGLDKTIDSLCRFGKIVSDWKIIEDERILELNDPAVDLQLDKAGLAGLELYRKLSDPDKKFCIRILISFMNLKTG